MSGPEEEEGESMASNGSLLELSEMSETTYGGKAGGVVAEAAGATGGGGGAGCATYRGMAKYGTERSKAG